MTRKFILALVLTIAVVVPLMISTVDATPGKSVCSGCHNVDAAVAVTANFLICNSTNAMYTVSVSNTYEQSEGWAVFEGGVNLQNSLGGSGMFEVPAGTTYEVWGVSDSDDPQIGGGKGGSNTVTINPECSPVCTDGDGDTYAVEGGSCGAVDCKDNDPAVNPGATEDCTNGIDDDCDGLIDAADPDAVNCPPACTDNDGDTYYAEGGSCGPADCDDTDPNVNPGAEEDCTNGIDDDCDGLIDAADPDAVNCPPACTDNDGDTYYAEGGSCGPADCDDTDPNINPGAVEDCTDLIDNDCDNKLDCDDSDCVGDPACPTCVVEVCDDGIDNDCDNKIDCSDKPDCKNDPACDVGGGSGGNPEVCTDGIDNDGDGKVDCADKKDCGKDPAC